jgi:glycosyltransferase involved in cell wall biosynthesis
VIDIRWFAPNRYCTLPVPALQRAGFSIALEGDEPCGAVVASDAPSAVEAFGFARRHRCPLGLNIADLPPWRLGQGRPDAVFAVGPRVFRLRRPWGGYPERSGYYSRLRYVARRAGRLWCPSRHSTEDVARRFEVSVTHLPFCYDSDRFPGEEPFPLTVDEPALSAAKGSPLTILSVSRLVPHKNHATILRAVARLATRPRLRIIGQGPEGPALAALAAQLGVVLELRTTWASDPEIVEAYGQADVVVSASRFEGFGLTPMEGIAMGVPVVASDIPPHREFLDGAVRFFPVDDDRALAEAIEAAVQDPPLDCAVRDATLKPLMIEACAARFGPELERLLSLPA